MFLRVILLFLLFFGGSWAFISVARHLTGKNWLTAGKVIIKAVICAIVAVLIFFLIAIAQHASN